ncbi:AAA family ATPase [Saccharibacillus endophyticus]|uniref:Phosphotransferase n=1 Tax=Saccharibacillus endophyticus TaxID=2060666 RepID=A0ABQ1ZUP0_9BACL|nr:AAA family ATPase [Saccharibacillus endophyticus]GGH79799.1 hypothetical protein GCM10007362_27140 [Saccharibacillus endophyticus]
MTTQQPCIILVTGIMASGKSTVGQLLAERFEKSVHVRGDLFRRLIVNDRKDMSPDAETDELDQLRLRYRLAVQAAETYLAEGFNVVIQDVVVGPILHEFVSYVKASPFHVVVLCPEAETVARREAARAKTGYGAWTVEALDNLLRNETPRVGLWLDSSHQTPEETVEEIWRRFREEAVVLP